MVQTKIYLINLSLEPISRHVLFKCYCNGKLPYDFLQGIFSPNIAVSHKATE